MLLHDLPAHGHRYQRCVGFDAMNATYTVTYEMDQKLGTDYHERFKKFLLYVQENDLMVAGSHDRPQGRPQSSVPASRPIRTSSCMWSTRTTGASTSPARNAT